jgi:hypothetical protein
LTLHQSLLYRFLHGPVAASDDFHLTIPRSVADALALPEGRKKRELLRELAVTLYREEMLSFGKARELAGQIRRRSAISGKLDDSISEFLWIWWTCSWHGGFLLVRK